MLDIDLAFRTGKIVEVEQAGFEAGFQHRPIDDNPYPADSWEHEVWANGHLSAEHIRRPLYSLARSVPTTLRNLAEPRNPGDELASSSPGGIHAG